MSDGEILHFGAVRQRLTGDGILRMNLSSLDDVVVSAIPSITMQPTTNREPTVLANFNQQRGYLHGFTQDIDEVFVVSKIIIYIKPVASGYPTE